MSSVALHVIGSIILTFETVNFLMVLIHQALSPRGTSPSTKEWSFYLDTSDFSLGAVIHTMFFWNLVAHTRLTSLEERL